jgi:hypothetical protein
MLGSAAAVISMHSSTSRLKVICPSIQAPSKFSVYRILAQHSGRLNNYLRRARAYIQYSVPGIVTIGPNFRFIADVSGDADLEL